MDDAGVRGSGLRGLPQVQRLLEHAESAGLTARHPRPALLAAARTALAEARTTLLANAATEPPDAAALLQRMREKLAAHAGAGSRRVLNGTGVVLHTNLGRAPLAETAALAAADAGRGYGDLEFDLATGLRGGRGRAVEALLCEVTGADAALAVNNAAAAVLLALSALAGPKSGADGGPEGGEVIVSRGEMVEIGGGFRIPEVVAQGGARLVEVGTTNKTRLSDYANAITARTRVLLKVHPSNYRVTGFVGEASLADLSALAKARGLVLMHDLGGGALVDLRACGLAAEPLVAESLRAGADLVAFSGDKLMGGPQAGLLVGREAALAPLRRHPLLRAVRLDKMTLAALEATLRLYRDPERARRAIPVLAMLSQGPVALQARAARLVAMLGGAGDAKVEPSDGFAGGGAGPGCGIKSFAVALSAPCGDADALAAALRAGEPAVVARIADGRVLIDMLAIADGEIEALAEAIRAALAL